MTVSTKEDFEAEAVVYLKGFAANVRRLREEHDPPWSQTQLYEAARLHRTEVGRIEAGEVQPGLLTLAVLAEALGVPIDAFTQGLPPLKERRPPREPRRSR